MIGRGSRHRFIRILAIPTLILLGSARWWPGWYWSSRTSNPVRRGAALAVKNGCLACHGPMGRDETANPGSRWGTVPSFFRGNATMYMKSPDDVEAFIREGHPPGVAAASGTSPFHMPAFGEVLREKQIADLAAFVLAADGMTVPTEGLVARGAALSLQFGCEGCHGVAGSGGVPNRKSFSGTVPGWVGPDFADLVRGEAEFGEWVLNGRSERMTKNRAASFFLDRANLAMPAFASALTDRDVEALWAYIQWIRKAGDKDPRPQP